MTDREFTFGRSLTSETPRRSAATPSQCGDPAGNRRTRTRRRRYGTRSSIAAKGHGTNFRSGQTLRARHRQRWPTMVEHREKRWSNASSRGIESDRSILWFTWVTQPMMKVERGCTVCPASARMPVPAATSQMRRKACLADPRGIRARTSKGVRVRGPGCRRCESTLRCPFVLQQCWMEPASSRLRRTPQNGRRDEPLAPMAGERIPSRTAGPRATKKRGRNGAKLSHS